MDSRAFDSLYATPNYPEILRVLTNGQGEWKLNSEGHAIHFKAKHLAYILKVWHHFITSRLIPTTNVYEVTAKRALLYFAILQDIPFDVGQIIKDTFLYNKDAKMNLGHPFLIFGLCKKARVPLENNEAWIHPIKVISVKKDKSGVPRPEEVYNLGNEFLDEDELRANQSRFGMPSEPTCAPSCTTRRPYSAISSPSKIDFPCFSPFTCHLHHHRSDSATHQGSSLHPLLFFHRH